MEPYKNNHSGELVVDIVNLLNSKPIKHVRNEIISGLKSKPKHISSKYFYDRFGSGLFEKITSLKEYYPTRTERTIFSRIAPMLIESSDFQSIVELGSGDCSKISILFDAYNPSAIQNITYYPVDVSSTAIHQSSEHLTSNYPGLNVIGYIADFLDQLETIPGEGKRLITFFGSTIGNLDRQMALDFVRGIREKMNAGDQLLLGFDLVKDREVLEQAYNDEEGVTAAFNKNILRVVNRTIKADFSLQDFEHDAYYDENLERIEMHLRAVKDIEVRSPYIPAGVYMRKGETIHTENSHKFSQARIHEIAEYAGLQIRNFNTDKRDWFALVQFEKPEIRD